MSVLEFAAHEEVTSQPSVACDRWLQVISHLDPARGGMSAVVPRLASEIGAISGIVPQIGVFGDYGESAPAPLGITISSWSTSRVEWLRSSKLDNDFRRMLRHMDGIHIHGLWETSTATAARHARKLGKPYVLSAHGMLEPWALQNKALKKHIYSALIEQKNLQGATCLHALTHAEAEHYRRFGCTAPIGIIPNGVDAPALADPQAFLLKLPQLRGRTLLLFLGRIHFKKGLNLLIPAWAAAAKRYPEATLVLAGPDSENSLGPVRNLIAQFGVSSQVVCTGMLNDDLKWSALAAASCFILPSYSEGLSVAVLEAMSMGVPVIVSRQCHIPEVASSSAGLVVETTIPSITEAIHAVLSAAPLIRVQMGTRGRSLAKQKYSWPVVAAKMSELYRWVTGGPKPASFEIEEVRK